MTAPAQVRPDVVPLDPDSPKGREVAARLTRTLARIGLEVAERRRRAAAAGRATAALVALVAAVLLVRHRAPEPANESPGSRLGDRRHAAGDWQTERDVLPASEQGSGRPWAGARSNVEGGGCG